MEKHREQVEKYICGIVSGKGSKPLAIYCNPDHCHVLVGFDPSRPIADLVRDIKSNSSRFINENRWIAGKFEWQEGYGAFSYGRSQLHDVVQYILNQPEHHRKITFREEYLNFLKKFEVEYDEQYLFQWECLNNCVSGLNRVKFSDRH